MTAVTVSVPNVVNLTQAAASAAIASAGLTVGTVSTAPSTTVPAGSVISQNPSGGTLVSPGSAVALVVSSGPPPVTLAVDKVVVADGSGTQITSPFSTSAAGELLVAFAGSDGPTSSQTLQVSGAGLSWTLVKRANAQPGTAEIWMAIATNQLSNVTVTSTPTVTGYRQSLVVMLFTGAAGVGASAVASAPSGAPAVSLTTTKAGSFVYGIGFDWDGDIARTLGAGQVMVHEWPIAGSGTFWVQTLLTPVASPGLVQLNDTAPTADRWDFAMVEIVSK